MLKSTSNVRAALAHFPRLLAEEYENIDPDIIREDKARRVGGQRSKVSKNHCKRRILAWGGQASNLQSVLPFRTEIPPVHHRSLVFLESECGRADGHGGCGHEQGISGRAKKSVKSIQKYPLIIILHSAFIPPIPSKIIYLSLDTSLETGTNLPTISPTLVSFTKLAPAFISNKSSALPEDVDP